MVKNKNSKQADSFKDVEEALTKTEQFLESHLNVVIYAVIAIVVIILGVLGIQRFYVGPRNAEAQEQMFAAQDYFSENNFELAVNGDGVSLGFLDIIDNYGSTKAGKLARYYTGISYLHMGEFQMAVDNLKKFKTDDMLLAPLAKSALADAYVEMEDYSKAISAYNDALSTGKDEFSTPSIMLKLALAYEADGKKEKALETLKQLKSDYPNNSEALSVEKGIARLNQ
ncbi:MAG: tetratricopeptide repeat protein [Prolixibacteraceae bacterium]|jgi:TolA-binding protein|nr:tetratricopeptide repeat protein [Prolixibacteraceae bacterium]